MNNKKAWIDALKRNDYQAKSCKDGILVFIHGHGWKLIRYPEQVENLIYLGIIP
jgi:hypothetical protein